MYAERESEGARGEVNARVGDRGGMVLVSVGREYVGGTRGSGVVSSAADV